MLVTLRSLRDKKRFTCANLYYTVPGTVILIRVPFYSIPLKCPASFP